MTAPGIFRKGQVIRYADGPTALLRVGHVRPGHGGAVARYWGEHCLGGLHGAYHEDCRPPDAEDRRTWRANRRWRSGRFRQGPGLVGAYED